MSAAGIFRPKTCSTRTVINATPTDKLVIEIVSCWDLPAEDLLSSDPYIKVKLQGHREYVHETKHIASSLNPIWDVKTGNLFTVHISAVQSAGKVIFKVKEHDRVSIKNETLGSAEVDDPNGWNSISPDSSRVFQELVASPCKRRDASSSDAVRLHSTTSVSSRSS